MLKIYKNNLIAIFNSHIVSYGTPVNLNYIWSLGAMAGILMIIQVLSGTFLGMHYLSDSFESFNSLNWIMADVPYGYVIRYLHCNGASMFFIVVYAHIAKALVYGSYCKPRHPIWFVGIIIFILSMATAFIGYVLPWGQMSLWGATVITNLFTTVPFFGEQLVNWLWGGFSVSRPTLMRFAALHFFLPYIILAASVAHIMVLHAIGSNNPTGSEKISLTTFFPTFGVKDLFSLFLTLFLLGFLLFLHPNVLGHPDNAIPAQELVTPAHIVPEWYFLPFYAILRSIPNKSGGVVAMFASLLILFVLPFLNTSPIRSAIFRPVYSFFLFLFFIDVLLLGLIGGLPVEAPFVFWGGFLTVFYFSFFIFFIPFSGIIEVKLNTCNCEEFIMSSPLEQFELFPLFTWENTFTVFNFIITNEWIFLVLILFFTSIIFFASTKKSSRNTLFLVPNRYNVIFNVLEKLVSSLVKENIKDLSAARVFPFIFCIFIFLICLNMIGMIPYSFTLTSHIAVSLNLSLTAFIMINILAIRKYGLQMFSLFLPGGTSVILALLLVPIEVVSFCFKPISLSIRLFANLMAGHTLLKVIAGFAYTLSTAGGFLWLVSFVPLLILIPLFFLEFAVALIQAFVFTVLICIYYADSNNISH